MADKKTTCCICGAEYEVCHFCPDVANFTPWRRICDTSKHYQIYLILSEYSSGVLSKADAVEQFKSIRISPADCTSFRPNIYKVIEEIFQEQPVSYDMVDTTEHDADASEAVQKDENSNPPLEIPNGQKAKYRKKGNRL